MQRAETEVIIGGDTGILTTLEGQIDDLLGKCSEQEEDIARLSEKAVMSESQAMYWQKRAEELEEQVRIQADEIKEITKTMMFFQDRRIETLDKYNEKMDALEKEKEAWKKQCEKYVEQIKELQNDDAKIEESKKLLENAIRIIDEELQYNTDLLSNGLVDDRPKKQQTKRRRTTKKSTAYLSKLKNTTNRKCPVCKKMKPILHPKTMCEECDVLDPVLFDRFL